MGYSPGFLLKNGQLSTLANCPAIEKNSGASSQKLLQKGIGGVSESLEGFRGLTKIGHFQNHGLQPRLFAQKRPIFDNCELSPIDTNSGARIQKSFQKGTGGVSESQKRFRGLSKIGHVQNHGLQSRLFAEKRPIFDSCELTRNRHKQWRKELEITLEGYRRRFRKFGGISRTYQNRSFSKPCAIAQAFCSKTANYRPLRIVPQSKKTVAQVVRNHFRRVQEAFPKVWRDFEDLPKSVIFKTMGYSEGFLLKSGQFSTIANCPQSTQKVAQGFRNHFRRVQEAFQRVRSDFEDLAKSVMFKTMGYSPGFLLKNGQFSTLANSPEINTNSRASSQKSLKKGLGGVSESLERFRGLTKIGHVQNHGLQPRLFAEKRPIFDPCELSRNRHKQWRKELEIILEGYRRRFRKFGGISRTYQNRSFSKPWAIAQAFCSKTANFRPLRIVPQSTQTVTQGVRNHFRREKEAFPKVWRDFEDFPKSVIFKTMGYSPGFLLKNGQFSTLANCPAIDTNSGARS